MNIRKAQEGDAEWLIPELSKFAQFACTRLSMLPQNVEVIHEGLRKFIETHLFLVAENDGEAAGFVAGLVFPHLFNPEILVLQEIFWWVREQYRGSRAALLLLNAFVEWGREHVDWIFFSMQHNTPATDRALVKRGFKMHEQTYLLEV